MTFRQELASWWSPGRLQTAQIPETGTKAPTSDRLKLPAADTLPTLITFLRHCGCPFAEKTFRSFRSAANSHPDLHFIAVSHSDREATDKWLASVDGPGKVQVIVDAERKLYAQWGLGVSNFWHVLNPWSMWSVYKTGKDEGIWNKPTESGNRWQTAGSFAVDKEGLIKWGKKGSTADEAADFDQAIQVVTA